jgi:hypothetical protein
MTITRTSTTNIEYNEYATNAIVLYPNPARNFINLDLNNINQKVSTVKVFDNIGQEIYNYNLSDFSGNVYEIPLNNLPNCLYFVSILSENKVYSKKFTIQK